MRVGFVGSRYASKELIDQVEGIVRGHIAKGNVILVGDNPNGVDAEVVRVCNQAGYNLVEVWGVTKAPRNGGVMNGTYKRIRGDFSYRDRQMLQTAKMAIFFWNKVSPGTRNAYQYARTELNIYAILVES